MSRANQDAIERFTRRKAPARALASTASPRDVAVFLQTQELCKSHHVEPVDATARDAGRHAATLASLERYGAHACIDGNTTRMNAQST